MEQTGNKLWKLLRTPVGPLVPYIDAFAKQLSEQGFKQYSISPQVRLMAKFSRWLKANHIGLESVTDEHAQRFLSRSPRRKSVSEGYFAAIRRLMAFLRQLSAIPEQIQLAVELTPSQMAIFTFGQHLQQDQGL